jgi:heme/copper-type cytochrome/quinol oxidase subunit 2
MIKNLFTIVLPLVLPAILYFIFVIVAQRRAERRGEEPQGPESFRDAPWLWLAIAGAVLVILTLLVTPLLLQESGNPDHYVPPQYKDGKVVPGHYN